MMQLGLFLQFVRKGISGEAYNISSNQEKGNYLAIDEIASIIAEVSNDLLPSTKQNI